MYSSYSALSCWARANARVDAPHQRRFRLERLKAFCIRARLQSCHPRSKKYPALAAALILRRTGLQRAHLEFPDKNPVMLSKGACPSRSTASSPISSGTPQGFFYQGTTSVVPPEIQKVPGFSRRAHPEETRLATSAPWVPGQEPCHAEWGRTPESKHPITAHIVCDAAGLPFRVFFCIRARLQSCHPT